MMPWLLVAIRKRVIILQREGYFLVRGRCQVSIKSFQHLYAKFEKMHTFEGAQTLTAISYSVIHYGQLVKN